MAEPTRNQQENAGFPTTDAQRAVVNLGNMTKDERRDWASENRAQAWEEMKAFGGGIINGPPEGAYWLGKAANYALGETGAISEDRYADIGNRLDYWNKNPTPFDGVNAEWNRLRNLSPNAASFGEIVGAGGLAKFGIKNVMGVIDKGPKYLRRYVPDWAPDWLKYSKLSPNAHATVAGSLTAAGELKGEELLGEYYKNRQNDGI